MYVIPGLIGVTANYLEIKVNITKENKERVLSLISQLVEAEGLQLEQPESARVAPLNPTRPATVDGHISLDNCYSDAGIPLSQGVVSNKPLGTWAMFNSFVPGKAALRVLAHILRDEQTDGVSFARLVDEAVRNIRLRNISGIRGFPSSRKASSIPRFATQLVLPLSGMGLISSKLHEGTRMVGLTQDGLSFSLLENPVIDRKSSTGQLSQPERKWLIDYLKKIDGVGFKEYSTLQSIVGFIGTKHPSRTQLVEWFTTRSDFQESTKSGSRYSGQPLRLRKQLQNLASTYVSSKIAILRELGVVSDARGKYDLEGQL